METCDRLLRRLAGWLTAIGAVFLAWMMIQISLDALFRYLFSSPIHGTMEVMAAYPMTAVVFFPLAYVTLRGEHITVTIFADRLSAGGQRWVRRFADATTLVVVATLLYYTVIEALFRTAQQEKWDAGAMLVPVWISRWFLPIGGAAMALVLVHLLIRSWRRDRGRAGAPGGSTPVAGG
ncbi:MAG: TRAP transporter small permease [Alphaproteobacteria bacterium]|nr:TRAP transporter small permease [Alphaproteobacteria bacterium]